MKNRQILAAFAVIALLAGSPVQAAENKPQNDAETYRLLNLFGDVFERVRAGYVEKVDDEKMIEAAITGMLSSLDPHSSYMNPKNFQDMQVQTRGKFGGLGIEVTMENGVVRVVSPIDDTPAARAGIKPGDLITHLDGEPVIGLTLQQAVEKMRGAVGTDLKVTIRREGVEPFDVTITRAVIPIRSVRHRLEGKVGYVRISSFSQPTMSGLEKAMTDITDQLGDEFQGLILDLRNNPGGLLDQAVAVSDAFLDKGEIVSTRARDPEQGQRFNARPGDLAKGKPIVVLINGGSASASEIVAGALQDHRRAIIMGTKSFGKGSVQTIIPLPQHGAMRLTTARYYTPSGRSIQAVGIEPDIVVPQARVEVIASRGGRHEADLRGALRNENAPPETKEGKEGAEEAPADHPDDEAKKPEAQDFQLDRALDLLRGLALVASRSGQ